VKISVVVKHGAIPRTKCSRHWYSAADAWTVPPPPREGGGGCGRWTGRRRPSARRSPTPPSPPEAPTLGASPLGTAVAGDPFDWDDPNKTRIRHRFSEGGADADGSKSESWIQTGIRESGPRRRHIQSVRVSRGLCTVFVLADAFVLDFFAPTKLC